MGRHLLPGQSTWPRTCPMFWAILTGTRLEGDPVERMTFDMRLDLVGLDSLTQIAWALVDTHGEDAVAIADRTITDLESEGSKPVADAWRGLRALLEDALNGRLGRQTPTIH